MSYGTIGKPAYLVALSFLCVACSAPGRFVIKLKPSDIQSRLDKKFPIRHRKLIFEVRVKSPRIKFPKQGERIAIKLVVEGLVANKSLGNAEATVTGGVRYERSRKEFVLTDPRLTDFKLVHLPQQYADQARAAVDKVVNRALPAVPIYRIPDKQKIGRALLKRAWVKDGQLHLEMGL